MSDSGNVNEPLSNDADQSSNVPENDAPPNPYLVDEPEAHSNYSEMSDVHADGQITGVIHSKPTDEDVGLASQSPTDGGGEHIGVPRNVDAAEVKALSSHAAGDLEEAQEREDSDAGVPEQAAIAAGTTARIDIPRRKPRFRDRPPRWWLQALAGEEIGQPAAPVNGATPTHTGDTMPEPAPAGAQTTIQVPEEEHIFARGDVATSDETEPHTPEPTQTGNVEQARSEDIVPARPAMSPGAATTAPTVDTARRFRGYIAAAGALILLGIALRIVTNQGSSAPVTTTSAAPTATVAPQAAPAFVPVAGSPLTVTAVLGANAGLVQPIAAAVLADGSIAVADPGNSHLDILNSTGRLVKSVAAGAGPLKQPYGVAQVAGGLALLDSTTKSISLFDNHGRFVRTIASLVPLSNARDLAAGTDGNIYVASPQTNSVLVLSSNGNVIRTITSPLGSQPGQLNQPSAVAVAGDNTTYVYDSQNQRIESFSATGAFEAQWPAPASDTLHSVHVLTLADGRLVASDPSGALLLYPKGSGSPLREPLQQDAQGHALGVVQPLGLATLPGNHVLVIDGQGKRLLVVAIGG